MVILTAIVGGFLLISSGVTVGKGVRWSLLAFRGDPEFT